MSAALLVALLGAESTGKSTLARALAETLVAEGHDAVLVPEYLREFCEHAGRTPLPGEQRHIAQEQTRRIFTAASGHAIVLADTTALMTAIYSEQVFGDTSLYEDALQAHRRCQLTLVCGLDLPWQADGSQMRDGPQTRAPVDACIRAVLLRSDIPFSVVLGAGPSRLQAALAPVRHVMDGFTGGCTALSYVHPRR